MRQKTKGHRRRRPREQSAGAMDAPTVRERLEHISRAFTLIGLALGFGHERPDHELDRIVRLDHMSIDALRSVIWEAHSETWWLQRLDDKVLGRLAPDDDQAELLAASSGQS